MVYDTNNIFAKILRGEAPSFKVYEDDKTYVMMDIMPQTVGHTLVLTKEPAANLFDLSYEAAQACVSTAKKIAPAIMKATNADGIVLSQFNGAAAGQTVDHVHFHLVPRYEGQNIHAHAHVKGDMEEIKALAEKIVAAINELN
ncbi:MULTISPECIES: HIT family protein [Pseudomonadota]|jgi:histidine triad (HIT) family protein|uniref:HIT family protein n=1 Tax=Advenella alkanexedens TaxID=1481665 RepID=A0ABS6NMB3_9BURK|nr:MULTISPECIES: HIT family protein [Advenella]MBV4396763.1 HIT family protein [Advenella alkanexedens]MDD3758965.1 HIT family protein [Advenella sp.]NLN68563.1 HIT family protein [Alcaligenaceae bacterium]WKU19735.1 HIT family protein [Advenella alkanexedens]